MPNTVTPTPTLGTLPDVQASLNNLQSQISALTVGGQPFQFFPHSASGTSGSGTEASPYTSTDNTAGIQTTLNAAASGRGGLIVIVGGRYNASAMITNTKQGVSIRADGMGFSMDPNAESEGQQGSKLYSTAANALFLSAGADTNTRAGGTRVSGMYIVNGAFAATINGTTVTTASAKTAGTVGVHVGSVDTCQVSEMMIQYWEKGLYLDTGADTPSVHHCAFVRNIVAIHHQGIYGKFNSLNIADNDGCGLWIDTGGATGRASVTQCEFVRCCKVAGTRGAGFGTPTAASVYLNAAGTTFVANTIEGGLNGSACMTVTGDCNQIASNYFSGAALNITSGVENMITGNTFVGANIVVAAAATGTVISGSTFINAPASISTAANKTVISGCQGATITITSVAADCTLSGLSNCTVTDNGLRTVIDGQSVNAGDPNSAGNWNAVTKINGLRILDTTNQILYYYHSSLTGGRKQITLA